MNEHGLGSVPGAPLTCCARLLPLAVNTIHLSWDFWSSEAFRRCSTQQTRSKVPARVPYTYIQAGELVARIHISLLSKIKILFLKFYSPHIHKADTEHATCVLQQYLAPCPRDTILK